MIVQPRQARRRTWMRGAAGVPFRFRTCCH